MAQFAETDAQAVDELSANKTATLLRATEVRVLIAQKDEESGVVVKPAQTATVTDSPTVKTNSRPTCPTLVTPNACFALMGCGW